MQQSEWVDRRKLRQPVQYEFLVVQNLVSPVILGVEFMQQHGVVLDFFADLVGIHFPISTTSVSNRKNKSFGIRYD